jgi:hypothetical protein
MREPQTLSPRRGGYTLFEVLLSLTLVTVVLLLVAQAVQTHLRLLDVSRMEVEEAQIARAVLGAIQRDLRHVIAAREESGELDSARADALETLLDEEATEAESSDDATTGAPSPEESALAGTTPGVYGESNWIQIDATRIPRGELLSAESTVAPTSSGLNDRVSDAKTVLYFMFDAPETTVADEEALQDPTALELRRGLVRRQLDRRVTQYAVEQGLDVDFDQYDQPISSEIARIEFQYYDGDTWQQEWDTEEQEALPVAVHVAIAVWRKDRGNPGLLDAFGDTADLEDEAITFSLTVALPVEAESIAPEEEGESGSLETIEFLGESGETGMSSEST